MAESLQPKTTAGETVGARRSEDAEQNNAEINVWHLPEDASNRTIIRMSPANARLLADQLHEVANALDGEYPGRRRS